MGSETGMVLYFKLFMLFKLLYMLCLIGTVLPFVSLLAYFCSYLMQVSTGKLHICLTSFVRMAFLFHSHYWFWLHENVLKFHGYKMVISYIIHEKF